MLPYFSLFCLALIFSTLSSLAGLGGGLFLIPVLILLFDLPVKFVAGTMLLAMVPYTLVATLRNMRKGFVNFRIGLIMEIGSVAGVLIGAHFSDFFPDLVLKLFFFLIAFYMLYSLHSKEQGSRNLVGAAFRKINRIPPFIVEKNLRESAVSIPALVVTGWVAGVFSGMLGIGGGFLNVPTLMIGIGLPSKIAVSTSLFMIIITASFGSASHIALGHVNFLLAGIVAGGMIFGALFGTGLLNRLPETRVRKIIEFVLAAAAVLILFR